LNHFFRRGSIAKEDRRKAHKGVVMALHQVRESELIAAAKALEQGQIRIRFACYRGTRTHVTTSFLVQLAVDNAGAAPRTNTQKVPEFVARGRRDAVSPTILSLVDQRLNFHN
jgi:hypothetical protein